MTSLTCYFLVFKEKNIMKKIPYGITDYKKIIENNFVFRKIREFI